MRSIDMSDYNLAARAWWWTTILLGLLAFLYALAGAVYLDTVALTGTAVLTAAAFLAGMDAIAIGGSKTSITSGDVFVFLALLLWGVPAATIVACTDGFAASCRTSLRWTSRLGSPAIMAITTVVSGSLFQWALEWTRHRAIYGTVTLLVMLLLFSLVYYLLNSVQLIVYVALKKRLPMLKLWRTTYTFAILPCTASASAAGLIFLAIQQNGLSSLLAAGPLVAIIFTTCHLQFKRADERANAAVEQARQTAAHLQDMEASEERFRSAFNDAPIGMALIDPDGRLLQVNRALCEVVGYSEAELLSLSLQNLTRPQDLELVTQSVAQLLSQQLPTIPTEQHYIHKSGYEVNVRVSTSLVRDPRSHSPLLIFQIQDITDRMQARQFHYDAQHDPLTGLPNRALFIDQLTQALAHRRRRRDRMFALLFLDCDRFKQINDSLGHLVGDQLLVAVARRLERATRGSDTVARLGGDEFTILLADLHSRKEAVTLVGRIHNELAAPFEIDDHIVQITASIGIALSCDNYLTPQEMLRDADSAMYHAKSQGNAQSALCNNGQMLATSLSSWPN